MLWRRDAIAVEPAGAPFGKRYHAREASISWLIRRGQDPDLQGKTSGRRTVRTRVEGAPGTAGEGLTPTPPPDARHSRSSAAPWRRHAARTRAAPYRCRSAPKARFGSSFSRAGNGACLLPGRVSAQASQASLSHYERTALYNWRVASRRAQRRLSRPHGDGEQQFQEEGRVVYVQGWAAAHPSSAAWEWDELRWSWQVDFCSKTRDTPCPWRLSSAHRNLMRCPPFPSCPQEGTTVHPRMHHGGFPARFSVKDHYGIGGGQFPMRSILRAAQSVWPGV
jgi:hypothetical protein